MKNLFQADAVEEVIGRIDKLQPESQRQWGKMDVAQMMAHCSATLDGLPDALFCRACSSAEFSGLLSAPPLPTTSPSPRTVLPTSIL